MHRRGSRGESTLPEWHSLTQAPASQREPDRATLERAPRLAAVLCGTILSVTVLLAGSASAAPVPAKNRIAARIVRTIAAPPEQPMHMPTDVAVDTAGRFYVVDGVNNRILRFAPNGTFQTALTTAGTLTFNMPVGIEVDKWDRLWVADSGNRRVVVVEQEGKLLETIELPTPAGGRPSDPTDVAVTPDGTRAYIVDNDNHRLLVRDNQGKTLLSLGTFGAALGQFEWPFTVALAGNGDVYVCETIGARLQRINARNQWAGQVSRYGVELGTLYRPKGVAVDSAGRIFVSDSTTRLVQVFNERGTIIGVLATGSELLRFNYPMGLCFDRTGHLCVVELQANRVAVVALPWTPATQPATGAAE